MRFDFNPFFNPGENLPWDEVCAMFRDQTAIAEQAGFTTVWCTEHHFAHNGYLNAPPNPILMCAHLGSRFDRIRVGQAPVVLPDWHPLRVAEDVALLDNMTCGRVDFGVARGNNERTGIQFNIDADKRNTERSLALYLECLDIVLRAWTEDPFRYKGRFYEFPVPGWQETNKMFEPFDPRYHREDGEYTGMYIHPRPYQKPHPPVWFMSNAPPTFESAGRTGMRVVGMNSSLDNLRACWSAFQSGAAASGTSRRFGEGVGMCVIVYVHDTMEQAARDVRAAVNQYYAFLAGARAGGVLDRRAFLAAGEALTPEDEAADWFDFLQSREIIWVGTADYVAEKIEKYQEAIGLEHIMLLQQFPGVGIDAILASMERFGAQVMPRFGGEPS